MNEPLEHRIIDPTECPRCGGHRVELLGDDDTPTATYLCYDCENKDEYNATYDVVHDEAVEYVTWMDAEGKSHTIYDRDHLVKAAAADMLRVLFMLDRVDRGGQIPWVHNAGITKHIEDLRPICLAFCRIWNDEIVPVLQKATGLENPVAKIVLPELPPDMALADVSSFVREYEALARLKGDAEIIQTLHRGHGWTENGAQVLLDLARRYGSFILRSALALAIALGIEDGSEGM